jgi:quinol-cytochrome oxidoreductase complex cytochrome b subunit
MSHLEIDERDGFWLAPLKAVLRRERARLIPGGVGLRHYLGGLLLFFLGVQAVTGVLLMVYYRPSADAAYYSTGVIMDEVRFGWLVRSLHRWGSDLIVALLFLHLLRVYFSRAYRPPRQLNWALGILLLVLVVALAFTGTLLPWDQYAYWYVDSARKTVAAVPVFGDLLLGLFWGGWEIGEAVLLRFYAFHVGVLPWLVLSVLSVHVLLVWHFGAGEQTDAAEPRAGIPFYPDLLVHLLIAVLLVGGLLLSVAILLPPELTLRANAVSPYPHAQPRWYLLPVRELLRDLPPGAAAPTVLGFFVLLLLAPVLDRRPLPSPWWLRVQRLCGVAVIAAWVLLTVRAYWR